jgi:deoxyribonuclease-2
MLVHFFRVAFLGSVAAAPFCLDPDGAPIDWWFSYKFHGGTDYAFVSSSAPPLPGGPLHLTGLALDAATSPLLRTLQQVVDGRSTLARVQWNDELPAASPAGNASASSGTSGHTKGVLSAGAGGGFFLTHTLPKFPSLTGSGTVWDGASTLYGQTFLCLTLDAKNVEAAAGALQFVDPYTYDSAVPAGLSGLLPNTVALVAGQRQAGTRATPLQTAGGASFTLYAKSGSTGLDIYEDVLQPAVESDMLVESWLRSPVMDTYCRPAYPWDSINVRELLFVDSGGNNQTWKETKDHAKVAIAAPPGKGFKVAAPGLVCAGDMNRMTSQWARGGGTTCFVNAPLWSSLWYSFVSTDLC